MRRATAGRCRGRWREGRTLLAYERRSVALAGASFLCTEQECELFFCLAPESRGRVGVLRNGVDADHYRPDAAIPNPFEGTEAPIVFTGAMDYWPNVDAVCWFAGEVLPALRRAHPGARLHIVGRNPAPAVRELAGEGVHVTGTVPDVRPYLQHAAAVVAPLRVARGIQNKILEAMAMARPVVTTPPCAAALDATVGVHLMTATSADEYLDVLGTLLTDRSQAAAVGAAGRERVLATYSWPGSLRVLDERLGEVLGQRSRAAAAPAFVTAAAAERP
jgi:sugar transferase (PEP-CTERM/EpsH1 system associated)